MRFSKATFTALPLVLAACSGAGGDSVAANDQAIVDTNNTTPTFTVSTALPSLGDHGTFPGTVIIGFTGASGDYTNGVDLAAAPMADENAWSATLPIANATAPNFPVRMAEAAAAARTDGTVDSGDMMSIFNLWSNLGATVTGPTNFGSFAGYTPVRSRWERVPYHFGATATTYADPPELAEQRERGARLYCAAREAVIHQQPAAVTMGSQSAFSVNILGQQIDFLVVEPTAVIGGPQRFVGSSADGAQAFEVPLEFGTRFTPIRGLGLPGFREVRYPVVLTSADTEALTHRNTLVGFGFRGMGDTVTVSHADSIRSAGVGMDAKDSIPLFSIGPIAVSANLDMGMAVGEATTDPDLRVLQTPPSGFPTSTRAGVLGTNAGVQYHDGAWQFGTPQGLPNFIVLPEGQTQPFWTIPGTGPAATRAWQDDDHRFVRTSHVHLSAGLAATAGLDIGPIQATISAGGDITADAFQDHILTDALIAEGLGGPQALGATALSVRPRLRASADFGGVWVHLHLELDLGFYTVSWDAELLRVGAFNIASYNSDDTRSWPESSALRLGTWSPMGDPLEMPSVVSHLPQGQNFKSFPQSVDSCLADPTPNPPPPPPCPATPPDNGGPLATNMCVYATMTSDPNAGLPAPSNICGNVSQWAALRALRPELTQCTADIISLLCSPVSQEQVTAPSSTAVAHLTSTSSDLAAVGDALRACGVQAAQLGVGQAELQTWYSQIVGFGACDSQARLLAPSEVIGSIGAPTTPPPVSGGGSCQ